MIDGKCAKRMNDWESILMAMAPKPQTPSSSSNAVIIASGNSNETDINPNTITPDMIRYAPTLLNFNNQALSIYEYIMGYHPASWAPFFRMAEPEVRHACTLISQSGTGRAIFPHTRNILAAFWLTPLHILKAVIVGQDPYPGTTKSGWPKAIGICFASERDTNEIPDSLVTVYKELSATVEDWIHPGHADIRCWGRQGVLLINTALTVEAGNAGSHTGFWKPFTEKLMDFLNENTRDCVFLLWGKVAQKAAESIYSSRHLKLNAYHPSSMNAHRPEYTFAGCNHFNLANIHLASKNIHPIDWRIP